jgi:hypothetical protein
MLQNADTITVNLQRKLKNQAISVRQAAVSGLSKTFRDSDFAASSVSASRPVVALAGIRRSGSGILSKSD